MMPIRKTADHTPAGYDYFLPRSAIAQHPVSPRDHSRLCVYYRDTGLVDDRHFYDLPRLLQPGSVLVVNETKVIPARITVLKDTGGQAKLLIIGWRAGQVTAWSDHRLSLNSRLRVGRAIWFVKSKSGPVYTISTGLTLNRLWALMTRIGWPPLPPYIKLSGQSKRELKQQYQAIFARQPGSVAAPTAALHFTPALLKRLKLAGVIVEYVTLHVNIGTFAPLTVIQLNTGRLHREQYRILSATARRLNKYKTEGRPIIAVGTTVARALESAVRAGRLRSGDRTTGIFIRPGYRWKFVDSLITNWHVPRSSLMMLVAALVGLGKLRFLYRRARRQGYRFLSFGDAMMVV